MPPGLSTSLVTDTYDATKRRLYEVKATSARDAVRQAIGQLLDYRRFVNDLEGMAVVLPTEPTPDLVELIDEVGMALVLPDGSRFVRRGPGGLRLSLGASVVASGGNGGARRARSARSAGVPVAPAHRAGGAP